MEEIKLLDLLEPGNIKHNNDNCIKPHKHKYVVQLVDLHFLITEKKQLEKDIEQMQQKQIWMPDMREHYANEYKEKVKELDIIINQLMEFIDKIKPPLERQIVRLRAINGYKYEDIARVVGYDQSTCSRIFNRYEMIKLAQKTKNKMI